MKHGDLYPTYFRRRDLSRFGIPGWGWFEAAFWHVERAMMGAPIWPRPNLMPLGFPGNPGRWLLLNLPQDSLCPVWADFLPSS